MAAFRMNDFASAEVVKTVPKHKTKLTGRYKVEVFRNGKLIETREGCNAITNEGLDHALDVIFNAASELSEWKIGITNATAVLDPSDTMGSHGGWTENQDYDETTRRDWLPGASSGQSITNGTAATFTMNAGATLHGIFVTSNGVKGSTTGTLWATANFSSTLSVVDTDVVKITYTVNAT